MKRVSRNLGLHENGTYYLDIKRRGRPIRHSLGTKNRREAKRRLKAELAKLNAQLAIAKDGAALNRSSNPADITNIVRTVLFESGLPVSKQPSPSKRPSFQKALEDHFQSITTDSSASKDRYLTQKRKVLRLCNGWDEFDPSILWSKVQGELKMNPRKRAHGLTHAPNNGASSLNQFVHYLRDFCTWLRAAGWSDDRIEHSVQRLKLLKVNSRRFEPPTPDQMATLVAQIRKEDEDSAYLVGFLMTTGCRLAGALDARWSDWSKSGNGPEHFTFREKGRKERSVPLTAQASGILRAIKESGEIKPANCDPKWRGRIFPLGDSRKNKAQRLLNKWAEELELPTAFFHSLRHYFASRALMSGVDEYTVANLVGDSRSFG